jgi:RHS repeat-associated protein
MLSQLQLRRALTLLAIFTLSAAHPSLAQVHTGTPRFGNFGGGPDIINLGNLNSHLDIPVLHKNGRGLPFDFKFVFDSSVWAPVSVNGSKAWQPSSNWGWGTGGTDIGQVTYTVTVTTIHCIIAGHTFSAQQTTWSNWSYIDGSGTGHPFDGSAIGTGAQCSSSGGNQTSGFSTGDADGSGYILNVPGNCCSISVGNVKVTSPTANVITPLSRTIQDSNGNSITSDGSGHLTDTLGIVAMTTSGASPNPVSYSYTAPSGATASFTQTFRTYTVQTNFGCSGVSEYGATSNSLVDKITLPDGSFYQFTYELTPGSSTNVTGRLASVRFPTGGTISYQYSGGSNGITCSDGSAATLTRTTPDGQWTYARTLGTVPASSTTITDPQGNQTVMQFANLGGTIYQTVEKVYQGTLSSGTLLRSTTTCYDGMTTNCATSLFGFPISQKAVTIQLGATGPQCKHVTFYDGGPGTLNTGVTNEQDDYDYGVGAAGALMKKTLYTYTYSSPPQLKTVQVQNGVGSTIAQTTLSYDETAVVTPSNQPTPQHTNSLPSPRRNVTTMSYGLTEHWTYFDTGQIATHTDTNGAQSTSNYGPLTATCGNAFPTSISEPLGLSHSMTWNCNGGVQVTSVDENNQTTSTTWNDPYFWHPNFTIDQAGNTTNIAYSAGGTVVTPNFVFNNSNSIIAVAHNFDGLGRPSFDQGYQSPSAQTFDTVSYAYDANGRPYSTSLPCSVGAGSNCPLATAKTTQTYDALNRPLVTTDGGGRTVSYTYSQNDVYVAIGPVVSGENTKRRQFEYDALGRLTSVCEVSTAAGSGNCAQKTAQTGFWTKYTYDALGNLTGVTQNAQSSTTQTRTYAHDSLRRLTSETNAENGTTTYTYDTLSVNPGNCTAHSSFGDLIAKVDANGNGTCFNYDLLHRVISIGQSYNGSLNASVTPDKCFVYDSATVNGVAMPNAKGLLARAYTVAQGAGCAASKITDEGFGYTARGEQSDLYELTPHSGTNYYYHSAQTYWPHGAPEQLSSNISGLPTITYGGTIGSTVGLDGEGRITQVAASSGQNPVTAVSYNPYGTPPQVTATLGSGDSDVFSFDASTGRTTKYQFNVNGQSDIGTLTWNSNGSLKQLAITDALNSADSQTCTYSHDDLSRIASVNCGASIWQQNFSYDAFGNITKTVPTGGTGNSFQPTYNSATNRMSSVAGFTPTYDANGNTLTDPSHTYIWDAAGRPVTVDGIGLTYDAFGSVVEQNRSGTYTEIVYSPTGGKLALMSGQTLQKGLIPLPGGGQVVYNASGLLYYGHSDHLGSMRLGSTPSRTMYFDLAHAPFGEIYASAGGTNVDPAFTGQRQDTVSGLFDFPAREYSNEGRWHSPDPAGLTAVDVSTPQSWNRYAYVLNSPLNATDPTGLWCVWEDGTHDDDEVSGGAAYNDCGAQGGHWDSFDTITGIFQQDGIVTQINTIYGNCTTSDCGAGMTLEGFDQSLRSYTQAPDIPSSAWVFTKSFFTFAGGPGNKPTCAEQTLKSISDEVLGTELAGSKAGETALKAAAVKQAERAAKYAAGRTNSLGGVGLMCPRCSSVFRSMMFKSEVLDFAAEAAVPIDVSIAAVSSIPETMEQARGGDCAAAFPVF